MSRHSAATTLARRPKNPKKAAEKVQSLRAQLADCLIAEDLTEAVKVLRGTLKATKHQQAGKFTTIEVPDHSSRISAAKLILEYAVGKPATVAEITVNDGEPGSVQNTDPGEVARRLRDSGLNLMDIVEVYTTDDPVVEDEDTRDQREQDERAAKVFLNS